MVKKLLSLSIIAGAGVVSACFGEGPTPSGPSHAVVLFAGQPLQGCTGTYIGPVAVGSGSGFVTMLPYTQQGGNGNGCTGGTQIPTEDQVVLSFNRDGGTLARFGSAGQSSQSTHDVLVATSTGVAYAYSVTGPMNTNVYVEPGHTQIGSGMGIDTPLGIAQAGSDLYAIVTGNPMTTGQAEPNNPEYPCCGGGGPGNTTQGSIWKVGAGAVAQVNPVCGTLDRCLVGNSSSLVYVERPNTTGNVLWQVTSLDIATNTPTMIASLSTGGEVPVGIDADDTTIAYATSVPCLSMNSSQTCNINECNVFAYDIASKTPKSLLSTNQWGCMDAKLANGYVYFTIVGWSQRTQHMFGRGIGRVRISDKSFESLDLGMRGDAAGPRRVFPSGDRLYLVDPLVMARIDATEIDGKQDIAP